MCSVKLLSCSVINVNNIISITNSGKQVAASGATMSLVELCRDGDLEGVKAALQSSADVNAKDEYGHMNMVILVTQG